MAKGDCPTLGTRPRSRATLSIGMSWTAARTLASHSGLVAYCSSLLRTSRRIMGSTFNGTSGNGEVVNVLIVFFFDQSKKCRQNEGRYHTCLRGQSRPQTNE